MDKLGCVFSASFNVSNVPSNISDIVLDKKIIKVVDILGRESAGDQCIPLFYIYDDGTVEKRVVIE